MSEKKEIEKEIGDIYCHKSKNEESESTAESKTKHLKSMNKNSKLSREPVNEDPPNISM